MVRAAPLLLLALLCGAAAARELQGLDKMGAVVDGAKGVAGAAVGAAGNVAGAVGDAVQSGFEGLKAIHEAKISGMREVVEAKISAARQVGARRGAGAGGSRGGGWRAVVGQQLHALLSACSLRHRLAHSQSLLYWLALLTCCFARLLSTPNRPSKLAAHPNSPPTAGVPPRRHAQAAGHDGRRKGRGWRHRRRRWRRGGRCGRRCARWRAGRDEHPRGQGGWAVAPNLLCSFAPNLLRCCTALLCAALLTGGLAWVRGAYRAACSRTLLEALCCFLPLLTAH